jgi:hypothetical protein
LGAAALTLTQANKKPTATSAATRLTIITIVVVGTYSKFSASGASEGKRRD